MQIENDLKLKYSFNVERIEFSDEEGNPSITFRLIAPGKTAEELMSIDAELVDYWFSIRGDLKDIGERVIFIAEAA